MQDFANFNVIPEDYQMAKIKEKVIGTTDDVKMPSIGDQLKRRLDVINDT